ncbi:MAG: TonB-dependent receptor [Burkholderiales bacterium]
MRNGPSVRLARPPLFVLAFVPAFAFVPLAAHSQTPVLKEAVVTSARSAMAITESLADVSVIDRAELERSGAMSLTDLLMRQQGIDISANGGPGSIAGAFVRGASTAQLLVLIDGQRIGSSTSGGATWSSIPLGQIERIEILRGPASSLYGADAIGGVVQIFTRRGEGEPRVDAEVGYGSYHTSRLQVGASGASGPLRFSVRAGEERSRGFNAVRNPQAFGYNPDRDGFKSVNVGGQLGFTVAPGHDLELQFLENRIDSQYDGGANFNQRNKFTLRTASLASVNRFTENWTSRLRFGETADLGEDISAFGNSTFNTKQRQYSWQNDVRLGIAHAQLAFERREEAVSGSTRYPVTERDTNAVVAVLRASPGLHLMQGSARIDDSSQFGRKTTGSVGYGYRFAPGWRASATAGTAFRAPTFADLYFPSFDNPNLRPERSRNAEGGLYYESAGVQTSVVYYRNQVEDLIVFTGACPLAGRPFGCPINVNRALLRGYSGSARIKLSQAFALRGTVDFAEPVDRDTGKVLPRRSEQRATMGLDYLAGGITYTADVIGVGRRFDDAANNRRMGGFALLDLGATYRVDRRWSVFARWNNVLNKTYELAADYARPGSNIFVGVRYQ